MPNRYISATLRVAEWVPGIGFPMMAVNRSLDLFPESRTDIIKVVYHTVSIFSVYAISGTNIIL